MRSSPSAVVLALCLAACEGGGDPPDPACEQSFLTYESFGEAFFLDWCRGCHSADVIGDMRQDAPVDVNFDTLRDIRAYRDRIHDLAGVRRLMPPAGGPSQAERDLLVEWLACGAP